ncbi:Kinesin-4 [Hibiscus syriacus]|uniref:Kinesin-4 n=1 Tax=Hibiscus syriacus TaxID=106335 RepID=A0A6A2XRA4_HIBSY|nr:Kinesin-4 [Hibiscus syriacus]
MATDSVIPQVPVIPVLEEVLQEHGTGIEDISITSSGNTEEASLKRNEATGWLRKTVGVGLGKDLPAMPSQDEFRLGLRSGKILCTALNKIQPGSVPNIVEGPSDSVIIPDGDALSEYPFFENVINFLKVIEELGIPPFEATDLEQGGNSSRIVKCVLALKSYGEWKKSGAIGRWKYIESANPPTSFRPVKPFPRTNSEPFMNHSLSRTASLGEKSMDSLNSEQSDDAVSVPFLAVSLSWKNIKTTLLVLQHIVESMITKVSEEYERRLASHSELSKTSSKDMEEYVPDNFLSRTASCDDEKVEVKVEAPTAEETVADEASTESKKELPNEECNADEESTRHLLKQKTMVEQQQYILELKHSLHAAKQGMDRLRMMYLEEFSNLDKHLHSLASGYQRVLEENRKLHNQVQDLKAFPEHEFLFRAAEVFSDTQPLIRSVLDGYNVCIFAYGQTGSGKTYTMSGPNELTEEGLGVNYRALGDLFELSNQRKETISYEISVQMLEIYNEQVRDLLAADCQTKRYLLYMTYIRNSSQNGINVPDANLVRISSTSDVINLLNLGQKNRIVFSTAMNDRSSRSHSCLTVHVLGKDLTSGNILRGCMHPVDLAGSERVDKPEVTGDQLKEAQHSDKSLSALGDVINSLASKSSHVPYRNSKLTQLLQDSLGKVMLKSSYWSRLSGGQAKTLMFVHIAPEYEAHGETLSTFKFAERLATVELGAAKVNRNSVEIKEPKDQIANLKAASTVAEKEGEPKEVQESQSVPTSPGTKTPSLETSPSLSQCPKSQ